MRRENVKGQCSEMMLDRHHSLICNPVDRSLDAMHCAPLQRMVSDVDMTC